MTATKYKMGDCVWAASYRRQAQQVQCPTCFGKREVTLILGDGTPVILPCGGCSTLISEPCGTITEHILKPRADPVTVTSIRTEQGPDGTVTHYGIGGGWGHDEDRLHATEEAALQAAQCIAEKAQAEENTRAAYIKAKQEKSYAWNAAYHLREAKKCLREAGRHKNLAVICKDRVRVKVEKGD